MKKILKKLIGLDKLEDKLKETQDLITETERKAEEAVAAAEQARKAEENAKLTPKERATARGEPWVAVLDTHVNKENPRNGFFELDWNEYFVTDLKKAGYGFDGDPDEEIVDRWFRDLARNILAEEGQDVTRGSGFINVTKLSDGKAEIK